MPVGVPAALRFRYHSRPPVPPAAAAPIPTAAMTRPPVNGRLAQERTVGSGSPVFLNVNVYCPLEGAVNFPVPRIVDVEKTSPVPSRSIVNFAKPPDEYVQSTTSPAFSA